MNQWSVVRLFHKFPVPIFNINENCVLIVSYAHDLTYVLGIIGHTRGNFANFCITGESAYTSPTWNYIRTETLWTYHAFFRLALVIRLIPQVEFL
jgi:hypothetical protein